MMQYRYLGGLNPPPPSEFQLCKKLEDKLSVQKNRVNWSGLHININQLNEALLLLSSSLTLRSTLFREQTLILIKKP